MRAPAQREHVVQEDCLSFQVAPVVSVVVPILPGRCVFGRSG
ncbi:hypothetical protein SFOMI_1272 [Sphingobium fuliginis]|uniref:Uncharacterized protein n=1 Tax=Sphingobium fuliginis (strain ATCC 27551) TaxID=336203 RepID=A0A292Z492_SPHSA|nr:hypothetical protein SFOMI_1272 [Sphingobium fuliginis]